jgi:hypothetical protein
MASSRTTLETSSRYRPSAFTLKSPRDHDKPILVAAVACFDVDTFCASHNERRTAATAATRSDTLSETVFTATVGATAATTAAIITAASATARTSGQIVAGGASARSTHCQRPNCSGISRNNVLDVLSAGFSSRATSSTGTSRTASAATAAANEACRRIDADAVISTPTSNAAAFSAKSTVKLALSAVSARAAGNEDAIFSRAAADAHVRGSSASFCSERTGRVNAANASVTTAVITAAVTLWRSADDNRQHRAGMHTNYGFHQATASGRRTGSFGRDSNFRYVARNLECLAVSTDVLKRLTFYRRTLVCNCRG